MARTLLKRVIHYGTGTGVLIQVSVEPDGVSRAYAWWLGSKSRRQRNVLAAAQLHGCTDERSHGIRMGTILRK